MIILPTFLVIGAMKAGTTSLYHYLDSHPEICMSAEKEPNYFLGGEEYKKGIARYSSLFKKNDAVAYGEASTNYSKRHRYEGVPARIYKDIPKVKLIYIVRDPIERAISHYIHNVAQGREKKSFAEAVVPDSIYLKTSMYFYQIEEYLKYFELNKIMFVESEELLACTEDVLYRIFNFLGVSCNVNIKNINQRYHISTDKKAKSLLDNLVHSERIKKLLMSVLPAIMTTNKPIENPIIEEQQLIDIKAYLKSDINKFRIIATENYKNWSI
ncbi:MAG: sulfotransferase domain-containing protein [Bacteroidetes bacterium]|nr:sulfotransferase domain-containing protein [Bacteroidota bacterium]